MTAAYAVDHSQSGDRAAALSDYTFHFALYVYLGLPR
jgi:hypothetical protein